MDVSPVFRVLTPFRKSSYAEIGSATHLLDLISESECNADDLSESRWIFQRTERDPLNRFHGLSWELAETWKIRQRKSASQTLSRLDRCNEVRRVFYGFDFFTLRSIAYGKSGALLSGEGSWDHLAKRYIMIPIFYRNGLIIWAACSP